MDMDLAMRVDATLIKTEREKRAWSQEQLATISGLGLRTVQRIEATGLASYESLKALASIFEMQAADFRVDGARSPEAAATPAAPAPPLAAEGAAHAWQQRPLWVRAMFGGSGLVRMSRRQLQQLERAEIIIASILGGLGLVALFVSQAAALPLLFLSALTFAAAYLASFNVQVGDKYSVWPLLELAQQAAPARYAFNVVLALVLTFPFWA